MILVGVHVDIEIEEAEHQLIWTIESIPLIEDEIKSLNIHKNIAEDKEFEECRKLQLIKNPSSKTYAFEKEQRYFKIEPKWIRYSNLSSESGEIFEINFD